jgi:hypothetical protein
MSWSILAGLPNPIIVDAEGTAGSGYVLKSYLPGTTTSTSLAIDSAGSSPQASITANADGIWEVSGNEVTPYIDRKCKWGIFANASDATANTPFYMGPFDNVDIMATKNDTAFSKNFATLALAVADTGLAWDVAANKGDALNLAGRDTINDGAGGMWDAVLAASVTPNGDNIVQCVGVPSLALVMREVVNSINVATVAAMIAIDFIPDQIITTTDFLETHLGEVGGGGARYEILTAAEYADTPDEFLDHTLDNGNIARILLDKRVDIQQAGCKAFDSAFDNQPRIQAIVTRMDGSSDTFNGGYIYVPRGRWFVATPVDLKTTHVEGLASMTLGGAGLHNTILQPTAGFSGQSVVTATNQTFNTVEKLQIFCNDICNHGIDWDGGNHQTLDRVFVQNALSHGFNLDGSFMLSLKGCRAAGNDGNGFHFDGFHTSVSADNCYSLRNTMSGYFIQNITYSAFTACASDSNDQYGYVIRNNGGVSYISCGAESNDLAGFGIFASAAQDAASLVKGNRFKMLQCSGAANDVLGGKGSIYSEQLDTSVIDATIEGFEELSVAGTDSIITLGTVSHLLHIKGGNFRNQILASAAVVEESFAVRNEAKSVTGANTPVMDISAVFDTTGHYSGLIHVIAGSETYSKAGGTNMASYVLLVTKSTAGSGVVLIASAGVLGGAATNQPSFTWTLDTANNQLEATPIGSASGTFYFYVTPLSGVKLAAS